MKRLTFKREFVEDVRAGRKRFTSRWKALPLRVGDEVAAVTAQDGRPAFLVPAKDAFAILAVESVECKPWGHFTDEDAARCGVTRDWYLREKPEAHDHTPIWIYGFRPAASQSVKDTEGGAA